MAMPLQAETGYAHSWRCCLGILPAWLGGQGKLLLPIHQKHHVFWPQPQSMTFTAAGKRVCLPSHTTVLTKHYMVSYSFENHLYINFCIYSSPGCTLVFEKLENDFNEAESKDLRNKIHKNSEKEESQGHLNTLSYLKHFESSLTPCMRSNYDFTYILRICLDFSCKMYLILSCV